MHLRGAKTPGWVPGTGRKELSQNKQEKEKTEVTFDFSEENIVKAKASFKRPYAGARGPFYTGDRKDWKFDNDDIELFRDAVWQGYLDASRTFRGIKYTDTNRKAFDNLAAAIRNYLNGDEGFDHEDWCKKFISEVKQHNNYETKYGQAQKVVNMAFKYLYCCKGAPVERFTPCHMPLDRITLLWYFSETGKYYEGWSYFTQNQYEEVQRRIRELLGENVLDAELVIYERLSPDCIVDLKKVNE